MRRLGLAAAAAAAILAACGESATDPTSAEPPAGLEAADAAAKMSAEDHAVLIAATGYALGADGTIENACGSHVYPQTVPADVGGVVGLAWLVVVPGGDETPGCYGDVPGDMFLLRRVDAGFETIFFGGGYINILPDAGREGVHDLALGGPGFEFPVFTWDGAAYAPAGRTISDADFGRTPSIP
jgi:hypothetical protein